jgi:hypothetical protein
MGTRPLTHRNKPTQDPRQQGPSSRNRSTPPKSDLSLHSQREDDMTAIGRADTRFSNIDEETNPKEAAPTWSQRPTPRASSSRTRHKVDDLNLSNFWGHRRTSSCSAKHSKPPTPPSGTAILTCRCTRSSHYTARSNHLQPKLDREKHFCRPRSSHQRLGPLPRHNS